MNYQAAYDYILDRLRRELSRDLYYHSVEHTLDVIEIIKILNQGEKVDNHLGNLIKTAALFHDTGMLISYHEHELTSVVIAQETLPRFNYSSKEIDLIAELIMVTRLPQKPTTLAEQIICDADLDNLGRKDFFINSFKVKLELQINHVLTCNLTEWFEKQILFLENHTFFTTTSKNMRNDQKQQNLLEMLRIKCKK